MRPAFVCAHSTFVISANVGQHVSVHSIMLPRKKGFTGHYLIVVLCLYSDLLRCKTVLPEIAEILVLLAHHLQKSRLGLGLTGELGRDSGWDGEGAMKCSKSGRPK